jgi:YD repeat-containing protein
MMISGAYYGAPGAEYRTEVDSFLKITSLGTAGSGPASFIVKTKGGEVMEFGATADSRIEATGKPEARVWALNKLQDVKGNYLTVTYADDNDTGGTNGEYRPTQIDYTGNSGLTPNRQVVFKYDPPYNPRTDQIPQYVGGSKILTTKLLTNVKTYANSSLVRDYRLTYEVGTATKRSRLKTISECDGGGNCLPAGWQMTWQETGTGTYQRVEQPFGGPGWDPDRAWRADFDGDGKTDVASFYNGNLGTFFSSGDGTYQPISSQLFPPGWFPDRVWVGDFDGDGKGDLASYYNGNFTTLLSNGDGTYREVTTGAGGQGGAAWDHDRVWVADFNGDGRADLASYLAPNLSTFFAKGDGTYDKISVGAGGAGWNANRVWAGDFDGDGKGDLASYYNGNFTTLFSNGDGTYRQVTPDAGGLGGAAWDPDRVWVGDFNGDGRVDFASYLAPYLSTFFAKGDGTYNKISVAAGGVGWYAFRVWVGDFNGDSKMDLRSYYNGNFRTLYSNGDGIYEQVPTGVGSAGWNPDRVWVGDFNGDQQSDLLSYYVGDSTTFFSVGPFADLLIGITNPLRGTTTLTYKPLTDDTVYAKDTGALAETYPNVDVQTPMYVVSRVTVNDGIDTDYNFSYSYGGLKAHHLGRGGLGFRWMATVDETPSVLSKKTIFYNQYKPDDPNKPFPITGTVDKTETETTSGIAFAPTRNIYAISDHAQSSTVKILSLTRVEGDECSGSATDPDCATFRRTAKKMEYDAHSNLTRTLHEGVVGQQGDERDERTEWIVHDTPTTWLHRPQHHQVFKGDTEQPGATLLREKWIYYDDLTYGQMTFGLVTKEELNGGDPQGSGNNNPVTGRNPVTTFVPDQTFGITTSVRDARGCLTTTEYDSSKTFPATITNCLGHAKTLTFDAGTGFKTSETDPNGAPTSYVPDGFGRLTKVIGPLDSPEYPTTIVEYLDWGTPSLQRVKTSRREEHGGSGVLWSEEYFDGLGRVDQVKKEGPGSEVIMSESAFDSRGLVLAVTTPRFSTEAAATSFITYDVLGRRTRVTNTDNTFSTTVYKVPGIVEITDERNVLRRKHFDGYGRLAKVEEFNNGGMEIYTTTYEYDAVGSLETVTNHLGHVTRMVYDTLGRKIAMCDPNMGTAPGITTCTTASVGAWVYTYSPAGDLLTQTDAKNQTLCFSYDALGRPMTKKQGQTCTTTLVTWTYDTNQIAPPPTGGDYPLGRVTKVDQPQISVITRYAYDKMGRALQTRRTLLGVDHDMFHTYDALSRITSENFSTNGVPDNDPIFYTYNNAG